MFAGVGKNAEEIRDALKAEILMFNMESSAEMHAIDDVAASVGKMRQWRCASIPTSTQNASLHFDRPEEEQVRHRRRPGLGRIQVASSLRHIDVVGVHAHIGSQLTEVAPFVDSLKKVLALIDAAQRARDQHPVSQHRRRAGHHLFGRNPAVAARIGGGRLAARPGLDLTLVMEPGRVIVGNAGIL